jgi:hypothetical protein
MKKNLLNIIGKAKKLTADEFTKFLDKKNVLWIWDDCDNILNFNEGRCVIDVIDSGYSVWFEDGELIEIYK